MTQNDDICVIYSYLLCLEHIAVSDAYLLPG
jgi:hypothetical protein